MVEGQELSVKDRRLWDIGQETVGGPGIIRIAIVTPLKFVNRGNSLTKGPVLLISLQVCIFFKKPKEYWAEEF
jgi:hypothetical protein